MDTRVIVSSALVIFHLDNQTYALALDAVERVLPMLAWASLPQGPAIALGVINLHGSILPVVDIRRRFGRPERSYGVAGHLLIARTRQRRLALPVDEVVGVREISLRTVTPAAAVLPGLAHVKGLVSLDDGVLFIHDLDSFLSLEEESALDAALEKAGT